MNKKNFISNESNRMMADGEEIKRQLEADEHDRNYVEKVLLDGQDLDVREYFA